MSGSRTCPGCGLELPASGLPWNPPRHTSPECWQLYGEVQGFEPHYIELVRDYRQLADEFGLSRNKIELLISVWRCYGGACETLSFDEAGNWSPQGEVPTSTWLEVICGPSSAMG